MATFLNLYFVSRYNAGLRDGASADCEKSLQLGFSKGVNAAVKNMIKLGQLRGKLCALQALHDDRVDTKRNSELLEQLGLLEHRLKEVMAEYQADKLPSNSSGIPLSTNLRKEIEELTLTINNFISTLSFNHTLNKTSN